jgi:hypothetical protein
MDTPLQCNSGSVGSPIKGASGVVTVGVIGVMRYRAT